MPKIYYNFLRSSVLVILLLLSTNPTYCQQSTQVRGKVSSEYGEAMPGVAVLEKGTTNGVVSDIEGNYTISLTSANATLLFRYLGYKAQEISIANRSTINVVLIEDIVSLQSVVVVGSRSQNRSLTDTPAPIDVIPIQEISTTSGQLDLNQLLQYVAPSFNTNRQSGSDGSDHVDPATIRGLGPDQTLVLINGKRRHQSSLINIFGTRGRGNTGTDLNTIPTSAIDRVEILRDGASAQYGSDAIAGVINIVLKSNVNELTANLAGGMYTEGDGENLQLSGNYGLALGDKGFANVTLDYLHRGRSNRPADPNEYDIYRRQFGDAASDNFSAVINMAVPINENSSIYAFGGYNFRDTDAYAWTREPDSDRNVKEIYPGGFDPHILSKITDQSASVGFRSKLDNWEVDINNTYGINTFNYLVDGTLNASLLANSPTRFDAGGFELSQNTTGLHFSRYYPESLKGLNIAFGTEYRIENYSIFAGEEGSYRNYGIIDTLIDGKVQKYDKLERPGGAQGFPGFRPENELNEYRTNVGAYLDTEFDFTDRFMIGAALRLERYSDFGNTLNGKIASRFNLSENLAIRGSVSTGFRAPSLAQIYFNTTFTDFVSGVAVDKVIASNNSSITRRLGIPTLTQEKAFNGSLGFTGSFKNFTATVDGYYVDIKDRIVLTGAFEDTDPDIGAELQALNVGAAQFFTNAVDTRTTGVDVILTYRARFSANSRLLLSYAGNFNKLELKNIYTSPKLQGKEDVYYGQREQYFLLASAPNSKMNFIADYSISKWGANLKLVRFGEVKLIDWLDTEDIYKSKITTDLALTHKFTDDLSFTVGASNLFDVYPDKQDTETESGGLWDPVQMGIGGRFVYSRLRFNLN